MLTFPAINSQEIRELRKISKPLACAAEPESLAPRNCSRLQETLVVTRNMCLVQARAIFGSLEEAASSQKLLSAARDARFLEKHASRAGESAFGKA